MTSRHHEVGAQDGVDGLAVAGLGSRIIAQLYDCAFVALLALVIAGIVQSAVHPSSNDTLAAGLLIGTVTLVVYLAYFTAFEVRMHGATPGKSAWHLKVVDVSGSPATATQLVVRNLARILDLVFGAGIAVVFWDQRGRRLGDMLARTVVIRVATVPLRAPGALAPPRPLLLRTPDAGPSIDGVDRLGERELAALRTFLTRPGLEPPLRARLASEMKNRLLDRMQLPVSAPERLWPPELFLERLYLQLERRHPG